MALRLPFVQGEDSLITGEEQSVASPVPQKLDAAAHLALVRLETERPLAVTRGALWAELAEFSRVGLKPDG